MGFEQVNNKINENKRLDFGVILDQVIDLYKKMWLKGFVVIIVVAIFSFGLNFLFTAFGLAADPSFWFENKGFELFSVYSTQILYGFPQSILVGLVSLGMLASFYRMCRVEEHDKEKNDEFFYFFKGEYFSKLFMLSIIYATIALLSQLFFVIPYIYTFIPLSYFAIVFANNPELTEMEIVKLSFNIGTKKWLLSFGLIFVTGILGMLGIIACGIGVLFTVSIMYLPVYFVYKGVVGFDGDYGIDLIGKE
jgi:hypothetical protein